MKMWLVACVAIAPLLGGCGEGAIDTSDIAGIQIERDSETCRATAAYGIDNRGSADGKTADEKNATYEQSYHTCMAARGYTIASAAP